MKLVQQSCQPCGGNATAVSAEDREKWLTEIPEWQVRQEDGVDHLCRVYRFSSYRQAVDFACQVAEMAEQEDHHPRLVVEWGQVAVEWWTHTLGGLHLNDFILAARCDACHRGLAA